jgi:hypothetical protein
MTTKGPDLTGSVTLFLFVVIYRIAPPPHIRSIQTDLDPISTNMFQTFCKKTIVCIRLLLVFKKRVIVYTSCLEDIASLYWVISRWIGLKDF